ncbi:hypothetical protein BP5796_07680 [Coleophoma crateriformis]|uniref:Rhodopsin domain-containing protein n=1 Tax=Coleophoma crateriformis TaxID=565419 RepID=A0A3D8RJX7_9HELO|nr:hypothetical protein BP5796_07680 [Coleophoma crateriformis]
MYTIGDLSPHGYSFFVFSIVTPIIASLAVFVRVYTRLYISKSFGVDDIMLLVCLFLFIGVSATGVAISLYGFGSHQDDISIDDLIIQLKYMYAEGIFFCLCLIAMRLSLCWLFLRFTSAPWQRAMLYGVAIISIIVNLVNLFRLNVFYCFPVSYYWDEYLYDDGYTCVSSSTESTLLYMQYAISIAADWVTSLLPLVLLKDSLMNKRLKFLTCCLLGIGIFASGAGIAALILTPTADDQGDYTYTAYGMFLAQVTEPFIALLAASFGTYYPLFKAFCLPASEGSHHPIKDPQMKDICSTQVLEGLTGSESSRPSF